MRLVLVLTVMMVVMVVVVVVVVLPVLLLPRRRHRVRCRVLLPPVPRSVHLDLLLPALLAAERRVTPVHEDVAGEGLAAEGALLEEVVAVAVRLVDVEHGRRRRLHRAHGTSPLHHAACGGEQRARRLRRARIGSNAALTWH